MKRTYSTPTVAVAGQAIRETQGNGSQSQEGGGFVKTIDGSVGFHV